MDRFWVGKPMNGEKTTRLRVLTLNDISEN